MRVCSKPVLAGLATIYVFLTLAAAKTYRIAALGDSLVEGWDASKQQKYPFTSTLLSCLQQRGKVSKTSFIIDNKGLGFSGVLMPLPTNLTTHVVNTVNSYKKANTRVDWCIFWLGGINDLYNSKPPTPFPFTSTVNKYQYLWNLCGSLGGRSLIMPQPALVSTGRQSDPLEVNRQKLASLMKARVDKAGPRVKYLDIAQKGFNGWAMSKAQRQELYSDGIHLSQKGYQRVGTIVCDFLAPYLLPKRG